MDLLSFERRRISSSLLWRPDGGDDTDGDDPMELIHTCLLLEHLKLLLGFIYLLLRLLRRIGDFFDVCGMNKSAACRECILIQRVSKASNPAGDFLINPSLYVISHSQVFIQ